MFQNSKILSPFFCLQTSSSCPGPYTYRKGKAKIRFISLTNVQLDSAKGNRWRRRGQRTRQHMCVLCWRAQECGTKPKKKPGVRSLCFLILLLKGGCSAAAGVCLVVYDYVELWIVMQEWLFGVQCARIRDVLGQFFCFVSGGEGISNWVPYGSSQLERARHVH